MKWKMLTTFENVSLTENDAVSSYCRILTQDLAQINLVKAPIPHKNLLLNRFKTQKDFAVGTCVLF